MAGCPKIMGILNITPDSFSGDGLMQSADYVAAALEQAAQMIADGADMLDVGGESTRPYAASVSATEEIKRTEPVIRALHARYPDLPLSIDTTKPEVARIALEVGATLINDVSGANADPDMAKCAVQYGANLVVMHNGAQANKVQGDAYEAPHYDDVVRDVAQKLKELALRAVSSGVKPEKIILDVGIGFGKTPQQNLRLINEIDEIKKLGFPVLLAASRKSFIGHILQTPPPPPPPPPPDERLEGMAAVAAVATMRGVDILRVHDVRFMARAVKMTDALVQS